MPTRRRVRDEPLDEPLDEPDPSLLFCTNCQVSVSAAELQRGGARRVPQGGLLCALCARAAPQERRRRRETLTDEFADDAPIAEAPPDSATRSSKTPGVAERLLRLERNARALHERLARVEQQLAAALKQRRRDS